MNPNRVAIYVREIDSKQENSIFIRDEIHSIKMSCILDDSTVVAVYKDGIFSDTSIENRAGIQEMLADSKKNMFDEVIVWESSRLASNLQDLIKISKKLKRNKVRLSSMIEPYDLSSITSGKLTMNMLGNIFKLKNHLQNSM